MAWIVFAVLRLSGHIRRSDDVLCPRRSNLLQRRLSEVSSAATNNIHFSSERKKRPKNQLIVCIWFLFWFTTDSHSAQNVSEKSHRPIGYDERSNLFSIWHAFRAIRAIANYRPAKNSPSYRIKFCVANTIWKRLKAKRHRAMRTAILAAMIRQRRKLNASERHSPKNSWRYCSEISKSTAIRTDKIWRGSH